MKEKSKAKENTAFSATLNEYYRDVKAEFQRHLEREISKEPKDIAPTYYSNLFGNFTVIFWMKPCS